MLKTKKVTPVAMLAQCPGCQSVKMQTNNKKMPTAWQNSIVLFTHLVKEICPSCRSKK